MASLDHDASHFEGSWDHIEWIHSHPQVQALPCPGSANCPAHNQLFTHFPLLQGLYFEAEKSFRSPAFAKFAADMWMLPIFLCAAYVVFCFGGKRLMKDRLPFDLQWPLAMWNLALSVFSFWGALRTVPHLLFYLKTQGLHFTVCEPAWNWYGYQASGLWTALFIYSKVPELVDTVFIVLRKKPLRFLHWYHHVSVLLFCWHSYATSSSAGLWFVSMNLTVHAVMYLYYFLAAIGHRPRWALGVTILQISQMFVGITICVLTYMYKQRGACDVATSNIKAGALMYLSYLVLFVHFAVQRYCCRSPRKAKKE